MIGAVLMTPRERNAAPPVEMAENTDGLQISARLASNRILPIGQDQNLAITVRAPAATETVSVRPPVALAIVIDRSGSMSGAPIANARAAALSALRQLAPGDSFAVVTYSSDAETVLMMQPATEDNKAAARAAIEGIQDDGGTCISCGLERASAELTRAPVNGLRRMLVISDGQANKGIYDRTELAQLAASKADRGMSISTVGVGLDFDEHTMRRLAEVGHGNYYFVEDTVALSAMFAQELGTLGQVVASDVRLAILPSPGVTIQEAYGYPMMRDERGVVVPIADLRGGETRKLVLRIHVDAPATGSLAIARVDATWRKVDDGRRGNAVAWAKVEVDADPDAVAASIDRPTTQAVEEALSARALEDAAAAYDKEGASGAQRVLERRATEVRAKAKYLPPAAIQKLEATSSEAIRDFAKAPAKAKKAASLKAYDLAR